MSHLHIRFGIVLALLAASTIGSAVPTADAARRPSADGAKAIKKVALEACSAPHRDCRFMYSRVSTRNARFAWAAIVGEGFSGVLLKRPGPRSLKFRVIGTQGGGVAECSYWRKRAPRPVLRDLRVSGLLDRSGTAGNCG